MSRELPSLRRCPCDHCGRVGPVNIHPEPGATLALCSPCSRDMGAAFIVLDPRWDEEAMTP